MTQDQIVGKANEEWGDATDDPATEFSGKAEQWSGELEEQVGDTADALSGDRGDES